MKSVKVLLVVFSIVMLASCSMSTVDSLESGMDVAEEATSASYGNEVDLVEASSRIVNLGSVFAVHVVEGSIELDNITYEKEVIIHYTTNGIDWVDANAYFDHMITSEREVWRFSLSLDEVPYNGGEWDAIDCEFAIKYTAGITVLLGQQRRFTHQLQDQYTRHWWFVS
jgi:hypothetical protein